MADIVISGNTSGSVTLRAPDTSGSTVLTLPTTTGTLVVTGGAQTVQFAAGSAAAPSITFTGDTNTGIFSPAADTIAFSEGGVESMRIDASGRVGIGVTPSPWSNFTVLQISSIGALVANDFGSGNTQVRLTSNTYWDGANFRYVTSNPAAMYSINGREHIWSSIASGTAGNSISFVESLRINPNGNLVLQGGTTTANGIGVSFPATQSASSDANCLDDYEEGTFTPLVSDGTNTASLGTSYYVKVGQLVHINVPAYSINVSALNASTSLRITGLPFAKNATFFAVILANYNGTDKTVSCGDGSSTTFNLYIPSNGVDYASMTRNTFGGNTSISFRFSVSYRTDS